MPKYRREYPRKDFRCKIGLHLWSDLDWESSYDRRTSRKDFLSMVYDQDFRKKVDRHCLICGKIETYLLDPDAR